MQRGRHVWVQSPQHLTPPNPGLVIDERRWSGVTYYHVVAVRAIHPQPADGSGSGALVGGLAV